MPLLQDSEGLHQLVMWHPNTKLEQELSQSEIDDVVQLQRFLLSVTAKDVSLLITFREVARHTGSDTGKDWSMANSILSLLYRNRLKGGP